MPPWPVGDRLDPEHDKTLGHTPVLVREVFELLTVRPGATVVDATVGLAGHAAEFASRIGKDGLLVGLDVDASNLDIARTRLTDAPGRVELHQANFATIQSVLKSLGVAKADVLLADLGISSTQLDDPSRGLSFQRDGPLDMRMDSSLETTAADLVNGLSERDLSDVLYFNAQEMGSRRIAKRICMVRREGRITRTEQLSTIVARALRVDPRSRKSKIHPATRTFMALRMAVNDEIPNLQALLDVAPKILAPGGRFGVIAFHSVEDRPVKHDFRKRKSDDVYRILTKKPIVAGSDERAANPRSRSAKLRVVERLPTD